MYTSPPCSLQSLSVDCLDKMSKSLAQNKTMLKLSLAGYKLTQVQDVKLFTHHLLLGLSGSNTLTDLTLRLPSHCWDWPQGELNILHCLKEVMCNWYIAWLKHNCVSPFHVACCWKWYKEVESNSISGLVLHQDIYYFVFVVFMHVVGV